jgi:hypothetical protein
VSEKAFMIPTIRRALTFEAFIDLEDGNELNEKVIVLTLEDGVYRKAEYL